MYLVFGEHERGSIEFVVLIESGQGGEDGGWSLSGRMRVGCGAKIGPHLKSPCQVGEPLEQKHPLTIALNSI